MIITKESEYCQDWIAISSDNPSLLKNGVSEANAIARVKHAIALDKVRSGFTVMTPEEIKAHD